MTQQSSSSLAPQRTVCREARSSTHVGLVGELVGGLVGVLVGALMEVFPQIDEAIGPER